MPIIRNPFRKQDENVRPTTAHEESVEKNGSKPNETNGRDPVEYKLSEINDSGVYLPPSPTEKKSFWGTTSSRSTTSSSIHRCAFNEGDQFSISRESFDSYRRSFDISARSPVIQPSEGRPRASLDSRTFQPLPRSSNSYQRPLQVPQTQEEDRFEDVNIDDPKPQAPKKRGLFARMVDSVDHSDTVNRPTLNNDKAMPWHHLTSRKRGQSGQGAELGSIPKRESTPKPEKQVEPQQNLEQIKEQTPTVSAKPEHPQAPEIRVDS
ncbi:uncharacterized protein RCC_10451 [Ramularia collo-cygni]|uniref:Uncharacterized protein n=1 Tax=Ramularia collo-cygni TaxID=112498 RepID=A0A2D3V9M2_9PEZI|nr:uncharacterized protein RCC_10451 [Ramularia collo-cygni]CZT24723.1 uncharacterized protein RCC_10451 [Ramularia collo-cygni]